MKLTELHPVLYSDHALSVFSMDCPCGNCHSRIRLYVDPLAEPSEVRGGKCVWRSSGTFPDTLTLTPSIRVAPWTAPSREDMQDPEKAALWNSRHCDGWHGWIRAGEVVTT
jgi:hypothetical protein